MEAFDSRRSVANGSYRGHIAELDALRAIAVGIVLLDHLWPRSLSSLIFTVGQFGWMAVDAFFVLSGFLITGILVDTRSRPDYFRNYYIRRSLRIFPLYYVLLLALFVMTHVSQGGGGTEYTQMVHQWGSPAWFAFYLGNFRMAYTGQFPPVAAYGPLWSLQIEEQFYLLLPLLIRFTRPQALPLVVAHGLIKSRLPCCVLSMASQRRSRPGCPAAMPHGGARARGADCRPLPERTVENS